MNTPTAARDLKSAPASPAAAVLRAAAPLALAGVAGAVLLAAWWYRGRQASPGAAAWLARLHAARELEAGGGDVLQYIRRSLVGLGKRDVRRLLGSPTAVGVAGFIDDDPTPERLSGAQSWYYRLNSPPPAANRHACALVVEFDDHGRARDAAFLATGQG